MTMMQGSRLKYDLASGWTEGVEDPETVKELKLLFSADKSLAVQVSRQEVSKL